MKTCWVGGGGVSVSDNQIREAKVDARGLSTLTEAVEWRRWEAVIAEGWELIRPRDVWGFSLPQTTEDNQESIDVPL